MTKMQGTLAQLIRKRDKHFMHQYLIMDMMSGGKTYHRYQEKIDRYCATHGISFEDLERLEEELEEENDK